MLSPKRIKYRKRQKGRVKGLAGKIGRAHV